MVAFLIIGWLIPWTHWLQTRGLTSREETFKMRVSVAPSLPPLTRWYGRMFDTTQSWLIDRYVCMRHQEHKAFGEFQAREFPSRAEGARIPPEGFPVLRTLATGMPAWRLPHVFIIDGAGLNDYVVARTPLEPGQRREMAHDRRAPPGYVESFRPNVVAGGGEATVYRRKQPLTAEEIRDIERRWRRRVDGHGR
jgi:arabinofuranosyltransferase